MDFPRLDLCEITVSSTQTACSVPWICHQWNLLSFSPAIPWLRCGELFYIMHRTKNHTSFLCWNSSRHPLHIRNDEASQLELWPFKQTWAFLPACKLNTSEHQIIFVLHIVEQCCRSQSRAGCGPALQHYHIYVQIPTTGLHRLLLPLLSEVVCTAITSSQSKPGLANCRIQYQQAWQIQFTNEDQHSLNIKECQMKR